MDTQQEEITVEMLDNALKEYVEARVDYESKKKVSNEASAFADKKEEELLQLLEKAEKDKWSVPSLGTVGISEQLYVSTPKSGEDKRALFGWILETYGQEGLDKYQTINAQALNSLYKIVTEEAALRGEVVMIPGLELPTSRKVLSLRRK